MLTYSTQTLKEILLSSQYPVALTGAGISVASSLPTLNKDFKGIPIKTILKRSFFEQYPDIFYNFYREILRWQDCTPNSAHRTLAKYDVHIITQNIDGLHQKAGSKDVIEIHGNLRELLCEKCNAHYSSDLAKKETLPLCKQCKSSILKPDIILYSEPIHHWEDAVQTCMKADLLLIIGTSLQAAPANRLPEIAKNCGAREILINKASDEILNF